MYHISTSVIQIRPVKRMTVSGATYTTCYFELFQSVLQIKIWVQEALCSCQGHFALWRVANPCSHHYHHHEASGPKECLLEPQAYNQWEENILQPLEGGNQQSPVHEVHELPFIQVQESLDGVMWTRPFLIICCWERITSVAKIAHNA